MVGVTKLIQGLILFSTLLGAVFLWQAYPLLPADVFYGIASGWVLFVVDSALTFVRPKASYYLGLVLGAAALAESLGQPEHYTFFQSGDVSAAAIFVLGSAAQALLIIFVVYYLISGRRKDPWAWPGGQPPT